MSGSDIRVIAYAITALVIALLLVDRIGSFFDHDYQTTEVTVITTLVGGVVALAIGRAIWPRNGGNGM